MSKNKRQEKKGKFLTKNKEKNQSSIIIALSLVLVAVLVSSVYVLFSRSGERKGKSSQAIVSSKTNFFPEYVEMVPIESKLEKGNIVISFDDVKKNKLVSFKYQGKNGSIPLLSYITPSGRLLTAVSMCEPCRSTTFHFESDKTITCNACGTKWELENLKGVSGACLNYPPDEIPNKVQNGQVLIEEAKVASWKPRI